MNGIAVPTLSEGILGPYAAKFDWIIFSIPLPLAHLNTVKALMLLSLGFAIVWLLPNVRQLFLAWRPTCEDLKDSLNSTSIGPFKYCQGSDAFESWFCNRLAVA